MKTNNQRINIVKKEIIIDGTKYVPGAKDKTYTFREHPVEPQDWKTELYDIVNNTGWIFVEEKLKSFIASQKELSYNEGYAKAVRLHEEKEKKAFEEGYKVGHDKCSEDEGN